MKGDEGPNRMINLVKSPGEETIGKFESNAEVDVIKEKRFRADDDVESKQESSLRRSVTLNDNVKRRRNVSISMGNPNDINGMQVMTPKDLQNLQMLAKEMENKGSISSTPENKRDRKKKSQPDTD